MRLHTGELRQAMALILTTALIFTSCFVVLSVPSFATSSKVICGQAAYGEKGGLKNKAGDQTGSEVHTFRWGYNSKKKNCYHWTHVVRCKDPSKAKIMAQVMRDACENNAVGYDRGDGQRTTFYKELVRCNYDATLITKKCETSCTPLIAACVNAAGYNIKNDSSAGGLLSRLKKTGDFKVYTSSDYTKSDKKLKAGDILIAMNHPHGAMVVSSPNSPDLNAEARMPDPAFAGGGDNDENAGDAGTGDGTVDSTLRILAVREPEEISEGDGFSIMGVVRSNYKLKKITVKITDAEGNDAIKVTRKPDDCWQYSIFYGFDSKVRFGTLSAGEYTYKITASDEHVGTTVLHENAFSIVEKSSKSESSSGSSEKASGSDSSQSSSTLKISKTRSPKKVHQKLGYKIKGIITSENTIKKVTVKVTTTSGKKKISVSENPNSSKYDLADIEPRVKFRGLKRGTYIYKVIAKDENGSKTLVSKKFKVIK